MKLTKANGRYEFLCDKEQRAVAKDAGFRFSADGGRPVWWTTSARRALAVSAYADDALRAELAERAKDEPDPLKITLRLEGRVWRYYSPDAASNGPAKNAQMRFKPDPIPHWWTESRDVAAKCFGQASALPNFVCSKENQEILVDQIKAIVTAVEMSRATDAEIDLSGLGGTPDPFQRAGIAWGLRYPKTIIGDEPGLGKTVQALGILYIAQAWPVVIVSPATMKEHWKRHLMEWCHLESKDVLIASGRTPLSPTQLDRLGLRAVCINYDILPYWLKSLHTLRAAAVIIDESHQIKNAQTKRCQACLELAKDAERVYPLTGTPLLNRPRELAPQLAIIGATDSYGGEFKFLLRYCNGHKEAIRVRSGKVKQIWNFNGASHLDELRKNLRGRGHLIRRLKSEVMKELPPKRRRVIEVSDHGVDIASDHATYERHQRLIAELTAAAEIAKASDDPYVYANAIASLREGAKASFDEVAKECHNTAVKTAPFVIEHVENLLDQVDKCFVFARHHDVVDALAAAFAKYKPAMVTGRTPTDNRQAEVDRFWQDPLCRVFIGSEAAREGINLSNTANVIIAEQIWVPGYMNQIEDRPHRRGQKNSVLVDHLVLAGSAAAQMIRTRIAKQDIIDKALDAPTNVNEWQNEAGETAAEPEDFIPELPEKLEASEPDDMRIAFDLPATSRMTVAQVKQEAEKITPAEIALVYKGLRMLAGMCDGAASLDGTGFNRMDVALGHMLASRPALTAAQACLGRKLLRRYSNSQLAGVCDELWS